MGLAHSPRIVTTNLLLNVDAGNIKNYDGRENILYYSNNFTQTSNWSIVGSINSSLSNNTAPDGSQSAYIITNNNQATSLIYQILPLVDTGNGYVTCSVYAKPYNHTGLFTFNCYYVGDTEINLNFNPTTGVCDAGGTITPVGAGWYRCSITVPPPVNTVNSFVYRIWPGGRGQNNALGFQFWGPQAEKGNLTSNYSVTTASPIYRSTILYDTLNNNFSISNNTWISYANSTLTFTRPANTSPNPKIGAVVANTASGLLASPTFLYNDNTWEVWYRINDRTPGAYDPTEGFSIIAAYQGYHSGFMHTSTVLEYYIWDSVGPTNKLAASWTLGISGTQVIQNNWTQIVVTRSGNTFTPYINGVQLGTGSTITTNTFIGTGNTLSIGSASRAVWTAGQGSYAYYSKGTFSNMKMYNRALSAQEIAQNFNALRGRFGI